ncbi:hypothetical protein AB0D08_04430 [Kitasatospora sp. NPDC048540]|uniref:hypothetical protein n=1 Tax=Kitasatospora sp. NPDC048540 TaxID=3155634 RepID=UPI0033F6BA23
MPDRTARPLLGALLLLATAGCTTVAPSADRAPAGRELDAAGLRAAALAGADLGPGYTVTVMDPGHDTAAEGRESADVPACQPVLDALAPGKAASGPAAETDLSVVRDGHRDAALYTGLLAFPAGRAERLQTELDRLLAHCTAFTSGLAAGPAGDPAQPGGRTRHRLARVDTPTPEGADAATAFTLTDESGTVVLAQRALLARVGTALAVFSTVGAGREPAAEPDPAVVRAQLAKLRSAQRG